MEYLAVMHNVPSPPESLTWITLLVTSEAFCEPLDHPRSISLEVQTQPRAHLPSRCLPRGMICLPTG